jgi:recombination protein RecR
MIVLKDADIESFEHMGSYKGLYLVLGTLIPLTEHHTSTKMRTLIESRIKKMPSGSASSECILALPVTTDGEHTRELITETLRVISETHPLTITTLGRGLSTGSELEYADSETLASALKSRA